MTRHLHSHTLILAILAGCLFALHASAARITLTSDIDAQPLTSKLEFLLDPDGQYSLTQLISKQGELFTPVHSVRYASGLYPDVTWFRLRYLNPTDQIINRILALDTYSTAQYQLYDPMVSTEAVATTGSPVRHSQRPLQTSRYGIPYQFLPGDHQIFIRAESIDPNIFTLTLESEPYFFQQSRKMDLILTAYLSITLMLGIIAIVTGSVQKELSLILLGTFCLVLSIFHASWHSILSPWIDIPYAEARLRYGFAPLSTAITLLLTYYLTRSHWKPWPSRVWIGLVVLTTVAGIVNFYRGQFPSIQAVPLVILLLHLISVYVLLRYLPPQKWLLRLGTLSHLLMVFTLFLGVSGVSSNIAMPMWFAKSFSLATVALFTYSLIKDYLTKPVTTQSGEIKLLGMETQARILQKLNHNLRTPINGVMGMSELLHETSLSANQQDYISTIQTSGYDLLRTADQIRALSRIMNHQLTPDYQAVDLPSLVQEVTQLPARYASLKNVELITEISPQVPGRVETDPQLLGQALRYLVENAVKHTDRGEVLLQLSKGPSDEIRFRITDTGNGIPNDKISRLFDFDSDPNSRTVYLDLPITFQILQTLGGRLGVSSEPSLGSTFWFSLDLPELPELQQESELFEDSLGGLRILIVDDNLTCRKVLKHQASTWGIQVDTVASGQEALARLHTQYHLHRGYDVVILDHQMPKMDGTQLANKIHTDPQIHRNMILIMMTGLDLRENDEEIQQAGVHFLLNKPVLAGNFRKVLLKALTLIRQEQETEAP